MPRRCLRIRRRRAGKAEKAAQDRPSAANASRMLSRYNRSARQLRIGDGTAACETSHTWRKHNDIGSTSYLGRTGTPARR